MAGGNPAFGRVEHDFYPTPAEVTDALLEAWDGVLCSLHLYDPCGGDGAMLDRFLAQGWAYGASASDLTPRRVDVTPMDIFEDDFSHLPPDTAIITNPPFKLAPAIIEHVLKSKQRPPFFALLLKSTFWHAASRYPLFQRYPPAVIHPLLWRPDFHGLGNPTMDLSWMVWLDKSLCNWAGVIGETQYQPLRKPKPE